MPIYQVTYDIKTKHNFEYKPFYDALAKLKAQHIQESIYLLDNSASQNAVYQHFRALVQDDDKLMVTTVRDRPDWTAGYEGTRAFIDAHFPR